VSAGTAPASVGVSSAGIYAWEPSSRAIAERYGLRPEDVLRFDTNTSPATLPIVSIALRGPFDPPLNEYPDSLYPDLTEAAARYAGARPDEVLVGAGADEVLDIAAKTFLPPGGAAMVPVPTYAMYGVLTGQRGARVVAIPRRPADEGFGLDVDAIVARLTETDMVWLCEPNNPTGSVERPGTLTAILDAAAALPRPPAIVVDEAYHEFRPASLVPHRDRYPHLVVVRTLSKAFAMAGLRVGYAVAARPTIERLERVRPPGSVSTASAAVGAAALTDPAPALANAAAIAEERTWLGERLRDLGRAPYPSSANFLLVRIGDQADADAAAERLLRRGIVPRTFGPANPLRGHLRFTVRGRAQNERLLEAIRG
jgi:histidinol-phosphate aminotransferase